MSSSRNAGNFNCFWSRSRQFAVRQMLLGICVFLLSNASPLRGQTVDWLNTSGSPDPWYHLGGNWIGGTAPGATDKARFNQAGAYEVWWDGTTASTTPEVGFLDVGQGDVTFLNNGGGTQWEYTINGSGGDGAFSDFSISGANTSLTSRGLHLHSLGGGQIINGATMTLDGSHAQGSKLTVNGAIGFDVSGDLNVQSGAIFNNTLGYIGRESGSSGTATVSGTGSQWAGSNLYVGGKGIGTLNVESGGLVSSSNGVIGNFPSGNGTVRVTGIGSQWNTSNSLNVGVNGSGTLIVEAGGEVSNSAPFGIIGRSSNSTGSVLVTGIGSKLNSEGLDIGWQGSGTLRVEAGGVVNISSHSVSIGTFSGSTGTAMVTGSGSQWSSSRNFFVGLNGNGTLSVEAGGLVSNPFGFIATEAGSTGAATVTGSGSKWINSNELYVGGDVNAGGSGMLTIADDGLVSVGGSTKLWGAGTLTLDGGSLTTGTLDNTSGGTFNFNTGTLGITGSGQALTVGANNFALTNGTAFNTNAGTTTLATDQHLAIGGRVTVVNGATLTLDGGSLTAHDGSQQDDIGWINVGFNGQGKLVVANGGEINDTYGFIGTDLDSESTSTATVTGIGSHWNNSQNFFVGDTSRGELSIEAGGLVSCVAASIARNADTTGIVTVTGQDSLTGIRSELNTTGGTSVGTVGHGTLNVEAGGVVNSRLAFIGSTDAGIGFAKVTGSGSKWNNLRHLFVGFSGEGTLLVEDGGVVVNGLYGSIGRDSTATGIVTVAGIDSKWDNQTSLYIGGTDTASGGSGILNIQNDGQVSVAESTVLWGAGSINLDGGSLTTHTFDNTAGGTFNFNDGTLTVNGGVFDPGASSYSINGNSPTATPHLVWAGGATSSLTGELTIGNTSQGSLTVSGGSQGSSGVSYIGKQSGSTGTVNLDGTGSGLTVASNLHVGESGSGSITLTNGATVVSGDARFGVQSGSTGIANIDNSSWTGVNNFHVGAAGDGTVTVTNGGLVSNNYGYVGQGGGVGGVNIDNGTWQNQNSIFIGAESGEGTLNIANNGTVTSDSIYLGRDGHGTLAITSGGKATTNFSQMGAFADGVGVATVTGVGSELNSQGQLQVGFLGSGSLNILGGGKVSSLVGQLGYRAGSTGTALVSGTGSEWNSSAQFLIGREGDGDLSIMSGGKVISGGNAFVGTYGSSAGRILISGEGSEWDSSGYLIVGYDGNSTGEVTVESGGKLSGRLGIGYLSSSASGTVNVDGGTVNSSFENIVGWNGNGSLNIKNGGVVSNALYGAIEGNETATGVVTVSGTNSKWDNQDSLYVGGSDSLAGGSAILNINDGAQVATVGTTRLWGGGIVNLNDGEFANDLLELQDGASIVGVGIVRANDGTSNQGLIHSNSGGTLDIFGSFENSGTGEIRANNDSQIIFHGDVVHNGAELRTDDSSGLVFLSDLSGNGPFTGDGLVKFAGELNPGNSVGALNFEGDVVLQDSSQLFIEIESSNQGGFDFLNVLGDFSIESGALDVSLINGFSLSEGDEFLFFNIDGTRSGFFTGLGQDSLVSTFGNQHLYIDYLAGDGNDIRLYSLTAVPEPGSFVMFGLVAASAFLRRRRTTNRS